MKWTSCWIKIIARGKDYEQKKYYERDNGASSKANY